MNGSFIDVRINGQCALKKMHSVMWVIIYMNIYIGLYIEYAGEELVLLPYGYCLFVVVLLVTLNRDAFMQETVT